MNNAKKEEGVHRRVFLGLFTVLVSLCLVSLVSAETPRDVKFKHADRNKDGTVDKKEMHMEKAWEQKQKAKVNTWWKKRVDTNGDGKVDSNELAAWKN